MKLNHFFCNKPRLNEDDKFYKGHGHERSEILTLTRSFEGYLWGACLSRQRFNTIKRIFLTINF